jgi:ABC-type sugar transport system permease subunit
LRLTKLEKVILKAIFVLFLLLFAFFRIIPIIYTIWRSFVKIDSGQYVVNGFNAYIYVLNQQVFWKSILNSFIISSIYILMKLILIVLFGEWLISNKKISNIVSKIAYLPSIIGGVVYALLFRYMLDSEGLFSSILGNNSLLSSPETTRISFAFILLWTNFGVSLLMYINRRKHLPDELINFSKIEGANLFQRFQYVILPYVKSILIIISLFGVIEVFSEVELPLILTFGGPNQSTITFGFFNYQAGFLFGNFGNASASTSIFLLFIFSIIFLMKKIYEKAPKNS